MRRGIIHANPALLVEALHAPEDARYTLASTACDAIHAALLLPASYRVVGIDFDRVMYNYRIYLEGEHLPEATDGYYPSTVYPTYTRYYDEGVTRLTSLTADGKALPLQ